jgi:hypothetical protein
VCRPDQTAEVTGKLSFQRETEERRQLICQQVMEQGRSALGE